MNIPKSREDLLALQAESGVTLPYDTDISPLAVPMTVKGKTFPNRIAYQAMEGCDSERDGTPSDLVYRRYRRFAAGGAGIIWYEATAVLREGRANPRQSYLTDENKDAFARMVVDIKETCLRENGYEPIVILQLTHSGRYSKPEGTPAPLIAYNNPIFEGESPIDSSRIVTDEYLDRVGEALIHGAALAEQVGFDGADIKCCHRYLMSELMSAYTRSGRYGGSYENRTRLFRETVYGALSVTSDRFIVTSRMNLYDGFPRPYGFGAVDDGGITPDYTEAIAVSRDLADHGVALLDFTMGNPYFNPHVNRPYAKGGYEPPEHPLYGVHRMLTGIAEVRRHIPEVAVISSGISFLGNQSPFVTAAAIRDGWFDFAGYGRQTLAYPDVARDLVAGRAMNERKLCLACGKCTEIMRRPGGTPGCAVRDTEVYTPIYRELVLGQK